MRDYFLGGPLAHQEAKGAFDKELVVRALLGHRTVQNLNEPSGAELLSLIAFEERDDPPDEDVAQHLEAVLSVPRSAPLGRHQDPFARLIAEDFIEICRLEATIPRREWLFFLIAFLRITTAMWLLGHLRITVLVREWLIAACCGKGLPTSEEVISAIRSRNEGVLHPSSTPTREVFEHVESYMRARVELRLIVQQVVDENKAKFKSSSGANKLLSLDSAGAELMPLNELLFLAQNMDWKGITDGAPFRQWLTRAAEKWPAWRSPRTRGQGKNIDEFIRVLYRSSDDDSGSGLLIRSPNSTAKIVPGHRLTQLFTYLAIQRKARSINERERGKLVLRDLEGHLFDYGIDFRSSSFGRPLLIEKLLEGGFLIGSPDAGESAEVLNTVDRRRIAR